MPKYYDVPDLPGVPPLLRDPQAAIGQAVGGAVTSFVSPVIGAAKSLVGSVTGTLNNLLGTGDDTSGAADQTTSWGVFNDQGEQALFPDSFLGVEYRNSRRISNYPLEQGAFESYNKVNDPFDVVVGMSCGGDSAKRTDFLASVEAMSNDLELYTVVTPEQVFDSVNLERFDYARKQHNGATLLTVNLYFKEIRVNTKSEYSTAQDDAATTEEAAAATTDATSDTQTNSSVLAADEVQNPASASPSAQGQVQAVPADSQQAAPAPGSANEPPAPPYVPGSASIFGTNTTTAPALKTLPEGYQQDPNTGLIRGPDGKVDRQLTINQGSSYIGPK